VEDEADVFPIVESGAAQGPIGQAESKGLDEMEDGVCCNAKARDVSRIGGDFGLMKDKVKRLGQRGKGGLDGSGVSGGFGDWVHGCFVIGFPYAPD